MRAQKPSAHRRTGARTADGYLCSANDDLEMFRLDSVFFSAQRKTSRWHAKNHLRGNVRVSSTRGTVQVPRS